jgi:hypothetical protein
MVSVVVILPFGSLWAGSMQTYDKRSHTFTRPMLDNRTPNSDGIEAPTHSTPSNSNTSGQRNNSGFSGSNARSGSRTPATRTDLNRPMGNLEAMNAHDLIDEDVELEETRARNHKYLAPMWSPKPEHAQRRFPAEQV